MIQIQTWGDAVKGVWVNTASSIVYVLLNIIVAILIFSAGWIAADFIGKVVGKIVHRMKLDFFFKEMGLEKVLNKGNLKLNSGAFVAGVIKWFVVAIFFMASLQVLGLDAVSDFIKTVLIGYIPKVVIAVLILLVAIIISEVVDKLVVAVTSAGHLKSSKALGALAKWSVIIFAILAVLVQLDIAPSLIQILLIGIVSALSLGFGLAFGLGGKDAASRAIDSIWQKVSSKI